MINTIGFPKKQLLIDAVPRLANGAMGNLPAFVFSRLSTHPDARYHLSLSTIEFLFHCNNEVRKAGNHRAHRATKAEHTNAVGCYGTGEGETHLGWQKLEEIYLLYYGVEIASTSS